MYIDESILEQKSINIVKSIQPFKILTVLILLLISYFGYVKYEAFETEKAQTLAIILNPHLDDIYFLDFRLLSSKLRPNEKYRIAKVVDITGDIVTLLYGGLFYQRQHAAISSIQYGQLSFKDYFQPKRYDIPHSMIKDMLSKQAIYLAKRPVSNKLYGNFIGPEKRDVLTNKFVYGKKENNKGEAFIKERYSETNFESAFELFQLSSNLGYAAGQVNLAEMYINGFYVERNLSRALHWLKQASLQSYKPAILKYAITCKQVDKCELYDFYRELDNKGVNIKVRELDFKLK